MGSIRRIKKQMGQPIAMADTKMAVNGCKVFLAHPNPAVAKKSAGQFSGFMKQTIGRASCVNIRDLYAAHFRVLQKVESGEDLIEIPGES